MACKRSKNIDQRIKEIPNDEVGVLKTNMKNCYENFKVVMPLSKILIENVPRALEKISSHLSSN